MGLLDSVSHLQQALDYHLARHNVLASNLAHVDTPGYQPLDVERTGTFHGALRAAMTATDPQHFGGSVGTADTWRVRVDPTAQPGEDGYDVNLDREAVKIAANHLRYETVSTLITSRLSTMLWASNDGRGA